MLSPQLILELTRPFYFPLFGYAQGTVEIAGFQPREKETFQLILEGCEEVSEMDWNVWGKALCLLSQLR